LWDTYQAADFVTYPSTFEGFGNAFLEAIYFRKPIMVNNYSIFSIDIKPKGFRVVEFDEYITDKTIAAVQEILLNPALTEEMVDLNYQLGQRYYSYKMLARHLETLLTACLGERIDGRLNEAVN
jgi:mannosylglucosylglycerate synthase